MMAVLHDPRAGMTETQRRDAKATLDRRRRLNGTEVQERSERAARTVARMDEMVLAIKAEIDPAPLVPDETWEERQARLNPLPAEKPDWFSIEKELDPDVRRVRIEDIQRAVATRYNVTRSDLLSTRRTANFVRPRQIAMYLARTITLRSLPEIGRRFGGRDHTTALHAVRKFEAIIRNDPEVADEIDRLSTIIKEMA